MYLPHQLTIQLLRATQRRLLVRLLLALQHHDLEVAMAYRLSQRCVLLLLQPP